MRLSPVVRRADKGEEGDQHLQVGAAEGSIHERDSYLIAPFDADTAAIGPSPRQSELDHPTG